MTKIFITGVPRARIAKTSFPFLVGFKAAACHQTKTCSMFEAASEQCLKDEALSHTLLTVSHRFITLPFQVPQFK